MCEYEQRQNLYLQRMTEMRAASAECQRGVECLLWAAQCFLAACAVKLHNNQFFTSELCGILHLAPCGRSAVFIAVNASERRRPRWHLIDILGILAQNKSIFK